MKNSTNNKIDAILLEKLKQLTKKMSIANIFYHPEYSHRKAEIIIITQDIQTEKVLESTKWIKNTIIHHDIFLHVLSLSQLKYQMKKENLLIPYWGQEKALIFSNQNYSVHSYINRKTFKLKNNHFIKEFYNHQDRLISEAHTLEKDNLILPTVLCYEQLFLHHICFLELLYKGKPYLAQNLHQRIYELTKLIPTLNSFFIKESEGKYYLISQLEKAKISTENNDNSYINSEILHNYNQIERKLFNLIEERITELKKLIKTKTTPTRKTIIPLFSPKKSEIEEITNHILSFQTVEEIFLISKKECLAKKTYYLLLIANKIGNAKLNKIQQSMLDKTSGNIILVLIAHSRIWIQNNTYMYQGFFKKLMTEENKIYQSNPLHPKIHWEYPYTTAYIDLDYYSLAFTKLSENYYLLRNSTTDNFEGLTILFFNAIIRAFKTLCCVHLSYLPNHLSTFSLWKLCLLADPELKKIEFLFEKAWGDCFFHQAESNIRFQHQLSRVTKQKLIVMEEVLLVLTQKINNAMERTTIL